MYAGIAGKIIVGSLGVFIVFRVMGKKAISELTPFDLTKLGRSRPSSIGG